MAERIPDDELRELIALGEKIRTQREDPFETLDFLDEWQDGFAQYLAASANLAVPLAEEVLRLRAEVARLTAKYVRCIGCGARDPLEEGTYCLRCVREGDRRAE